MITFGILTIIASVVIEAAILSKKIDLGK
jgi:hypothetical protein